MNYYLAHWYKGSDGAGDIWQPPSVGCVGCMDLRPLAAQGTFAVTEGYGFFAYGDTVDPALMPGQIDLGNNLDGAIKNKRDVQDALGVVLQGSTVKDVLWELMTTASDPTGTIRSKPIMPGHRRDLLLYLNGLIRAEDFDLNTAPHKQQVIENIHIAYRELRAEAQRYTVGDSRTETHLRMLKTWERKYRENYQTFIPSDLPDEGTREPRTTFADAFTRADNTDLNAADTSKEKNGVAATWQWTETQGDSDIQSNELGFDNDSFCFNRCEDDLSSDDMSSYATLNRAGTADFVRAGPVARHNASAVSAYFMQSQWTTSSGWDLQKVTTGTRTGIGAGIQSGTPATDEKDEVTCDGSTIAMLVDDVSKDSVTDTSFSGQTRAGVAGFNNSGADRVFQKDWFCEDLRDVNSLLSQSWIHRLPHIRM